MLRDTIIAAIRTGVAAAVGLAIAWLVGLGVAVPDGFTQGLVVVTFGLVVAGYNAAVGLLERRVSPAFGVLLGVPRAPAYQPRRAPSGDGGHVDLAVVLVSVASAIVVLAVWYLIR